MTFNLIPLEAFEKLDIPNLNVLDVRPREQFESFHIPTAVIVSKPRMLELQLF